jgi:Na+-driven multidrug efflux pump
VTGAGLASTIAIGAGLLLMLLYFSKLEKFVFADRRLMVPQWALWRRMILVGLPAGGEFALMFVYFTVIYLCLRDFGPTVQAGFGVGSRVMQSIFLPALAIAFAAAPLVGQNFGARLGARVRQTFWTTAWISSVLMSLLTAVCIGIPDVLVRVLTKDAAVVAFAADFLRVVALNFLANGIIFTCSSVFQGLGNTWPALIASGLRMFTFVMPALWMSSQPWFTPRHLWWLSVVTVTGQALICLWLVRRELAQRLAFPAAAGYQPIA